MWADCSWSPVCVHALQVERPHPRTKSLCARRERPLCREFCGRADRLLLADFSLSTPILLRGILLSAMLGPLEASGDGQNYRGEQVERDDAAVA